MYQSILFEQKGNLALITLNRPRVLNALSLALKEEVIDACRKVKADPGTRALIMTGAGDRAFSAGQDLSESKEIKTEAEAEAWVRGYEQLYGAIRDLDIPVIAAVNGYAMGAGCQLALCADIRISAETAKYGMPEINAGLPCIIGTYMFWEFLGPAWAIDLILTGDHLDAQKALMAGLTTRVVPADRLMAEAEALAGRLAEKAPTAIRENKIWFRKLSADGLRGAIDHCVGAQQVAYTRGEARAKQEAFVAKGRR